MTKPAIDKCLELAHSIRLGELYPNAISIVDAIEEAIDGGQYGSDTATDFTQMIKKIITCQVRQDWLGVADYLEYDLPELLDQSNRFTRN